jgi:RimJ/RimL family protein N-acetyltransferase
LIQIIKIEESHIPLVQRYASNPKIGETCNVPNPYPIDGAKAWYKHIKDNQAKGICEIFTIEFNQNFAGIISLNKLDLVTRKADVDYWVRSDLHNRGIATEAVRMLIEYAMTLGVETFNSGCLSSNLASKSVLQKNGFAIVSTETLRDGKFSGKEFSYLLRTSS